MAMGWALLGGRWLAAVIEVLGEGAVALVDDCCLFGEWAGTHSVCCSRPSRWRCQEGVGTAC